MRFIFSIFLEALFLAICFAIHPLLTAVTLVVLGLSLVIVYFAPSIKAGLRKLYYQIFPRYRRLDFCAVLYVEGDRLIKESAGKPESEQWVIAKEEDTNHSFGVVMLERRERIR